MIEKTYNKTKNVLKKLLKIIKKPEMIILPGNLSFSLILSIFPAIILLGYIFSKLNISAKVLTDLFAPNIPSDIVNILEKFIDTDIGSGNVFITVILTFIFASNGTNSIITTTNILYKNEGGETIERRVKSFFLVILLMFVFSITVFILGFGSSILKMIPGMNKFKDLKVDDKEFVRIEAIISSMTDKERKNPKILNGSRRIRIANGSGTTVQQINQFMKSFEMTQAMMKKMKDKKGMKNMMKNLKDFMPEGLDKM